MLGLGGGLHDFCVYGMMGKGLQSGDREDREQEMRVGTGG